MARDGAVYACQSCGSVQTKWAGQCPACGAWNSLVEELTGSRPPGTMTPSRTTKTRGLNFEGLHSETPAPPRLSTGVAEFDRVCGGGVVPGSAILLAGDPGVGKSTLLLQVAGSAALGGVRCAYISGEEAVEQIRARAGRMGLSAAPVKLAAETFLREIIDGLKRDAFDLVVIDSIQTLWSDAHEAGPGSVTQVRACAGELVRLAKTRSVAIVLVGHVTKDGQIAGPRIVEHMVDAVGRRPAVLTRVTFASHNGTTRHCSVATIGNLHHVFESHHKRRSKRETFGAHFCSVIFYEFSFFRQHQTCGTAHGNNTQWLESCIENERTFHFYNRCVLCLMRGVSTHDTTASNSPRREQPWGAFHFRTEWCCASSCIRDSVMAKRVQMPTSDAA